MAAASESSSGQPQIVLHNLNNSRSQRVLWLLEELELPYEIVRYKRNPQTMLAPKELKAIHPLGKSPTVVIKENGKETTLAESGAIVEYLVERYGKGKLFVQPDSPDRAEYLYWLHYAEGSFMLYGILTIILKQIPKQSPWIAKPLTNAVAAGVNSNFVKPNLHANLKFINDHLEGKQYFVGDRFTAADIIMSYPMEGKLLLSGLIGTVLICIGHAGFEHETAYKNIQRWLKNLRSMPSWQRAEERGDPRDFSKFQ